MMPPARIAGSVRAVPDHVAFLKGMNLGRRRITNEELRAAIESLGLDDVSTFRASGNVVFSAGRRSDATLRRLLEGGLDEKLGYPVPTFVRSAPELRAIAAVEPFGAVSGEGKLQVALLHDAPSARARDATLELAGDDRLALEGRELYWLPAGRLSDSALDFKRLAELIGPSTVRTMGTIEQIVSRWFEAAT